MKNSMIGLMLVSFIAFTSCDVIRQSNNTQRGAAIGTTAGAVAGGVIGNNVGDGGNTAIGAIIGAVVGGAAGALIGNQMDKQAREISTEMPGAEVNRVGEGISVTFDENSGIYFATDHYDLNQQSTNSLNQLVTIFKKYPNTNILLEGHTDNTGRAEYNMTLSKKRAQSVYDYLADHGISSSRLDMNWYGETQPKYDNSTAEGRSKNRRVEVAITANQEMKQDAKQQAN